jgi:hypothetical protein
LTVAALFLLGALLSGITILWGINPHDEGLVLQAGARISEGQLPYRDFYANYGPGQYFVAGGLDVIFGPSLLSWRILRVALDATVGVLAYTLCRRDTPLGLALAAWLAVATAMAFPSLPSPNPAALALGLGALLLADRHPAGAGALAGLAVVFRVDAGVAAVAGAILAAAASGGRRAALRVSLVAGVTAAALLAPVVLDAPREFWDQTLGFALHEQRLQRLPLPGAWKGSLEPNKIVDHYFPYILLGGAFAAVAIALRVRLPLRLWAPVPLILVGVAYLLVRTDEYHYIALAAVLPILLATDATWALAQRRVIAVGTASGFLALLALHFLDEKRIQTLSPPPLSRLDVDVADGVKAETADAAAIAGLVRYVRARVPPGKPVFVANPRYDRVKVGDPLLYVLLNRPNPTRYDVMQPGVVTTAPVQREMARDLDRARPALIVKWLAPVASEAEPNGAGKSSGVHVLDRYLARTYVPVRRFGDYQVLRRR